MLRRHRGKPRALLLLRLRLTAYAPKKTKRQKAQRTHILVSAFTAPPLGGRPAYLSAEANRVKQTHVDVELSIDGRLGAAAPPPPQDHLARYQLPRTRTTSAGCYRLRHPFCSGAFPRSPRSGNGVLPRIRDNSFSITFPSPPDESRGIFYLTRKKEKKALKLVRVYAWTGSTIAYASLPSTPVICRATRVSLKLVSYVRLEFTRAINRCVVFGVTHR